MSDEPSFFEMIQVARANKEYLSFIDLPPGTKAKVKIEKVIRKKDVVSIGGRKEKVVDFLKFEGKDKLLWLSLGKLKSLRDILGTNVKDWIGKEIILFADPAVRMKGVEVGGLVILKA